MYLNNNCNNAPWPVQHLFQSQPRCQSIAGSLVTFESCQDAAISHHVQQQPAVTPGFMLPK